MWRVSSARCPLCGQIRGVDLTRKVIAGRWAWQEWMDPHRRTKNGDPCMARSTVVATRLGSVRFGGNHVPAP